MNVQSRRGMVWGNITRMETKLTKLEDKETLTEKEQRTVSKMGKKPEALSTKFKAYHCAIVEQIKDQNKLAEEQAVLDDHEDKVDNLMEHLDDLAVTTEPVMPHASDMAGATEPVRQDWQPPDQYSGEKFMKILL